MILVGLSYLAEAMAFVKINSMPYAGFVYEERGGWYVSDMTHRVTGANDAAMVIVKIFGSGPLSESSGEYSGDSVLSGSDTCCNYVASVPPVTVRVVGWELDAVSYADKYTFAGVGPGGGLVDVVVIPSVANISRGSYRLTEWSCDTVVMSGVDTFPRSEGGHVYGIGPGEWTTLSEDDLLRA